jgi:hypothetical protein
MSASGPNGKATEDRRELDQIAAELYSLLPDAFAAARDDEVRQARTEGRPELARALAKLRRPTQSAWLVNLLWRKQPDDVEKLLQLAGDLGRAQAEMSIAELLRLSDRRRDLEIQLLRDVRHLAEQAGINVTASMERDVQETLDAALARSDVADEIRSGRLVKPASYAGFGTTLMEAPTQVEEEPAETRPKKAVTPSPERKKASAEDRAAQRTRERREEAELRVHEARAALETSSNELDAQSRAAEEAIRQRQHLRERVDELQQQLRTVREEALAADNAALAATRRRDQSKKAHEAASQALERAEQQLNAL